MNLIILASFRGSIFRSTRTITNELRDAVWKVELENHERHIPSSFAIPSVVTATIVRVPSRHDESYELQGFRYGI